MYLYDDILFSNVNRMYDYVQTHPTSNLAAAFSQVFTVNKDAATGNVTSIEPVRTAEGKIDIRKMHNVMLSRSLSPATRRPVATTATTSTTTST